MNERIPCMTSPCGSAATEESEFRHGLILDSSYKAISYVHANPTLGKG